MKVQYTISISEAQKELATHFAAITGWFLCEVIIKPDFSPPCVTSVMEAITHIKGHFDYRGSEKIAAIKWYRDWAAQNGLNSGLAECKNFVESLA